MANDPMYEFSWSGDQSHGASIAAADPAEADASTAADDSALTGGGESIT
jgi:hypothetical protein